MDKKISLIAVAGPTASGKSALALSLCKSFGGELLSFDSMQIYRGMNIGTAKPTMAERAAVPHHLLDICDPSVDFSVADFAALAHKTIEEVEARHKLPVLCGGTGLYLDAVLYGIRFGDMTEDPAYRRSLLSIAEAEGAETLHHMLCRVDEEAGKSIHPNNIRRVIRALEIHHVTGKSKTEWDREAVPAESPYRSMTLALDYRNRDILYERIRQRVMKMFEDGLENEVRLLRQQGLLQPDTTAGGAIGYKEFLAYLDGEISLDAAQEAICVATRHYAKRQLTWLRRRQDIVWLYPDDYPSEEALHMAGANIVNDFLCEK